MLFCAFMILFASEVFNYVTLDEVLRGKHATRLYVYGYNLVAWIGVAILWTAVYYGEPNVTILTSLFLFILAACIGMIVLVMRVLKKSLSKSLVILQFALGVIAVILLLYYILYQKKDSTSIYADKSVYSNVIVQ